MDFYYLEFSSVKILFIAYNNFITLGADSNNIFSGIQGEANFPSLANGIKSNPLMPAQNIPGSIDKISWLIFARLSNSMFNKFSIIISRDKTYFLAFLYL